MADRLQICKQMRTEDPSGAGSRGHERLGGDDIYADPVPPGLLGTVKRPVRLFENVSFCLMRDGKVRDAETACRPHIASLRFEYLILPGLAKPFANNTGIRNIGFGQQQRKLLAAKAPDNIDPLTNDPAGKVGEAS